MFLIKKDLKISLYRAVWILFAIMLLPIMLTVGCGPRETLVNDLGNAENSIYTPDGRLFVSGHSVWEIRQGANGYDARNLTENLDCEFTGMAVYRNHLFVICFSDEQGDAWLMRGLLSEVPEFEKIYQFTEMSLPNGMAIDNHGRLYIADETLTSPEGQIIRLSLTDDDVPEVDPSSRTVWLTPEDGAQSPNGMVIVNKTLYFTNIDTRNIWNIKTAVKRVPILGDEPGTVQTLFERPALGCFSFFDDLTSASVDGVSCLVVADYLKGTVLILDTRSNKPSALLYETDSRMFAGPTSCIVAKGMGFGDTDLLVTEGGVVLIDPNTSFGNRLSIVRHGIFNF